MADATSDDFDRIDQRISEIEKRMAELSTMFEFSCSTDAQYRMVEAERTALQQERNELKEILEDI